MSLPVIPQDPLPVLSLLPLSKILPSKEPEITPIEPPAPFIGRSTVLLEVVVLAIECAEGMVVVIAEAVGGWSSLARHWGPDVQAVG